MENEMEDKFEDWKGKEAISGKHGGIRAASIVCGKYLKLKTSYFYILFYNF